MRVSFTVPGEPRGKGRPRFGRGRTYTDSATVAYEAAIKWSAKAAMGATSPLEGALTLHAQVRVSVPQSASLKRRALMLTDKEPPAKKPDVDNYAKALLDGMNGIAYRDDSQVVSLHVEKVYSETPGMFVVVAPFEGRQ